MQTGNIEWQEMYRTFNCGVGLVLIVAANKADESITILNDLGEQAWRLGEIHPLENGPPVSLNK